MGGAGPYIEYVAHSIVWKRALNIPFHHHDHFPLGAYQESVYALMCVGIPIDGLPVNEAGALDLTNWYRWLQHRCAAEGTRLLDIY
jgi:hypothetical protein